ncbi:trypsin-like serine protease [Candidatus Poribacteria bacterium]|nr:trypsin-like serine protease [Candidatus Poribacteria bacterium]
MRYHKEQFFKRNHFVVKCFAIAMCLLLCSCSNPDIDSKQIAKRALSATVYLEMVDRNGLPFAKASGFFIKKNQVVTNFHVIKGAAQGTAKLVDQSTIYSIEGIIATDEKNDLVLLKVTALEIQPLFLSDSDHVKVGDSVYVAGNPQGLEGTFSHGIISSVRGDAADKLLQMTAPISQGSSGGPVLNVKGKVVGVSVASLEGGQNLNFAIPSNYVKTLLTQVGSLKPLISADTYVLWGDTNYSSEQYKAAISDYDMAIQMNSDDALMYIKRGKTKTALEQYEAAIYDYDMAIRIDSENYESFLERAKANSKLGDNDISQRKYTSAIVYFNAAIHDFEKIFSMKQVENLMALEREVIFLAYSAAYFGKILAHVKLGNRSKAIQDIQHLNKIVEKEGNIPVKAQIKELIDSIPQLNNLE